MRLLPLAVIHIVIYNIAVPLHPQYETYYLEPEEDLSHLSYVTGAHIEDGHYFSYYSVEGSEEEDEWEVVEVEGLSYGDNVESVGWFKDSSYPSRDEIGNDKQDSTYNSVDSDVVDHTDKKIRQLEDLKKQLIRLVDKGYIRYSNIVDMIVTGGIDYLIKEEKKEEEEEEKEFVQNRQEEKVKKEEVKTTNNGREEVLEEKAEVEECDFNDEICQKFKICKIGDVNDTLMKCLKNSDYKTFKIVKDIVLAKNARKKFIFTTQRSNLPRPTRRPFTQYPSIFRRSSVCALKNKSYPSVVKRHPSVIKRHPSVIKGHPSVIKRHPSVIKRHPSIIKRHPSVVKRFPAEIKHAGLVKSKKCPAKAKNYPIAVQSYSSLVKPFSNLVNLKPFSSLVKPFSSLVKSYSSLIKPFSSLVKPFSSLVKPFSSLVPYPSVVKAYSSLVKPFTSLVPYSSIVKHYSTLALVKPYSSIINQYSTPVKPYSNLVRPYSSLVKHYSTLTKSTRCPEIIKKHSIKTKRDSPALARKYYPDDQHLDPSFIDYPVVYFDQKMIGILPFSSDDVKIVNIERNIDGEDNTGHPTRTDINEEVEYETLPDDEADEYFSDWEKEIYDKEIKEREFDYDNLDWGQDEDIYNIDDDW